MSIGSVRKASEFPGLNRSISSIESLLRCPHTKEPLKYSALADAPILVRGLGIDLPNDVSGLLHGTYQKVAYPVRGQIIDLRPESIITAGTLTALVENSTQRLVAKQNVQQWYDSFGWKRNEDGVLNDSAFYSRSKSTPYGLYESMSHLAQAERFTGGKLLLDAASGAIAHPEYLAYSIKHEFRVCVDFSELALEEASQRIGDHGIYILADVCHLPFADESFDGVVSGYTIQHIHRDAQRAAIDELYRVLKPGFHLCIMASQETGFCHSLALRVGMALSHLNQQSTAGADATTSKAEPDMVCPPYQLYGHCWDFKWWKDCADSLSSKSQVQCLRLFGKPEFDSIVGSRSGVRRLRKFETLFCKALARASSLIAVDIEKPQQTREELAQSA